MASNTVAELCSTPVLLNEVQLTMIFWIEIAQVATRFYELLKLWPLQCEIWLHEENMLQNRKSCVEDHNNGACAPYVASAARIGQFAEAWKVMLQNYDRESDWQLNFCAVAGANGDCANSASFKTFPQALDWFLHQHGYLPASTP